MAEGKAHRVRTRSISRGGRRLLVLGGRRGGLTDLYHGVLRIPLWGLLLSLVAVYAALNLAFGGLYLLDPQGIQGLKPGDYANAVFFSVQTVSTVGYGLMAPSSLYANIIVS